MSIAISASELDGRSANMLERTPLRLSRRAATKHAWMLRSTGSAGEGRLLTSAGSRRSNSAWLGLGVGFQPRSHTVAGSIR